MRNELLIAVLNDTTFRNHPLQIPEGNLHVACLDPVTVRKVEEFYCVQHREGYKGRNR